MNSQSENEGADQEKEITVVVNGREKVVDTKELTFEAVVRLAFPDAVFDDKTIFTVTYRRAEGKREQGSLTAGQSVKVKEGTIFDVDRTNRS